MLCSCNGDGCLIIGPDLFEGKGLELGLSERILRVCGKSVKTVSFFISFCSPKESFNYEFVYKFMEVVGMYCPNIEKVIFAPSVFEEPPHPFNPIVPDLLERYSSQLQSIQWVINVEITDTDCLPDISVCTQIRELEFPASPQLVSFLRTSGASLESLDVSNVHIDGYAELLDVIEQNCRKLSKVYLWDCSPIIEIIGEERYASFLSSFGSQLTHAHIALLSIEKLAQVLRACPNLKVGSTYAKNDRVVEWERISLLGSKISELTVMTEACRDEKCKDAIAKCTNLERLTIVGNLYLEEEVMESRSEPTFLFSLSLPSVIHLEYTEFIATYRNIEEISSVFKSLRYLTLNIFKIIENGIDFEPIAHANPHLDNVSIVEYDDDENEGREKNLSMEVLRMLVNAFSKCRSFNFSIVNNREESVTRDEIHDICSSLPCRGVDVQIQVGSTWYRNID